MNELFKFLLEINEKTNYTATLRYMPTKLNGKNFTNYAVDLMLNDQNVYHRHSTDFKFAHEIIGELKEKMQSKTTYYVKYDDGTIALNYKATSLPDAKNSQAKFKLIYGIDADILEVIDADAM